MTDMCPRPRLGSEPGWSRPRLACEADRLARLYNEEKPYAPPEPVKTSRPVPWLAEQDLNEWDPWGFDQDRSVQLRERNLCQVCGGPRGAAVFVLVRDYDHRDTTEGGLTRVEMFGGALCSLRCARLTAAVCPRYAEHGPIDIYTVPAAARVDIVGCGEGNDDELDVTVPGAALVATVGGAP